MASNTQIEYGNLFSIILYVTYFIIPLACFKVLTKFPSCCYIYYLVWQITKCVISLTSTSQFRIPLLSLLTPCCRQYNLHQPAVRVTGIWLPAGHVRPQALHADSQHPSADRLATPLQRHLCARSLPCCYRHGPQCWLHGGSSALLHRRDHGTQTAWRLKVTQPKLSVARVYVFIDTYQLYKLKNRLIFRSNKIWVMMESGVSPRTKKNKLFS